MEIQTVEAIEFGGGDLASTHTYFVRVIYPCPHCHQKHKQLTNGKGVMPVETNVKPSCGGDELRVVAWDSVNYKKRLDEARSRATKISVS